MTSDFGPFFGPSPHFCHKPQTSQDQDTEFAVIVTSNGLGKRIPLSGFRNLRPLFWGKMMTFGRRFGRFFWWLKKVRGGTYLYLIFVRKSVVFSIILGEGWHGLADLPEVFLDLLRVILVFFVAIANPHWLNLLSHLPTIFQQIYRVLYILGPRWFAGFCRSIVCLLVFGGSLDVKFKSNMA